MSSEPGLRERKKQQTHQLIGDAAARLFAERGYDAVTVAEVARAADVSEMTVFNHYPAKEDLFFSGMQFFEERLLQAVRDRPADKPVLVAFGRQIVDSCAALATPGRIRAVAEAGRVLRASRPLLARERDIVSRYTRELADLLAEQTGREPMDPEPVAVAHALMGTHRALVDYVRDRALAGAGTKSLAAQARSHAERLFALLDNGFSGYGTRPVPTEGAHR